MLRALFLASENDIGGLVPGPRRSTRNKKTIGWWQTRHPASAQEVVGAKAVGLPQPKPTTINADQAQHLGRPSARFCVRVPIRTPSTLMAGKGLWTDQAGEQEKSICHRHNRTAMRLCSPEIYTPCWRHLPERVYRELRPREEEPRQRTRMPESGRRTPPPEPADRRLASSAKQSAPDERQHAAQHP